MKPKPDTAVAAPDKPRSLLTPAEQMSSEMAKRRASNRVNLRERERDVRALGVRALQQMADELGEAPTDLPHSDDVKAAYQDALRLVAREDWPAARQRLFDLGVQALGWAARIDLAETREAGGS